jgi:hypothetical protein
MRSLTCLHSLQGLRPVAYDPETDALLLQMTNPVPRSWGIPALGFQAQARFTLWFTVEAIVYG